MAVANQLVVLWIIYYINSCDDFTNLKEPFLDLAVCLRRGDGVDQIHLLPFAAVHGFYVKVVVELQTGYALETLLEMRLNAGRLLRLRQDIQHLRVRKEEESGERAKRK